MPKFACTEIYTPTNRKEPRRSTSVQFSCESKDLLVIAQAAVNAHGDGTIARDRCPFGSIDWDKIKNVLVGQELTDIPEDNVFNFTFPSNDGEFYYEVEQCTFSETPITDENIVKLVEERVALSPTYEDQTWDDVNNRTIRVTRTNTVEHELAVALHKNSLLSFIDYDKRDLLEYVSDILMTGTKGYSQMSIKELLAAIRDEVVEPAVDDGDELFIEDLVARFGW